MKQSQITKYVRDIGIATSRAAIFISREASEVTQFLPENFLRRLATLPVGSRVLEIGIGRGIAIAQLRRDYPHLKFYGTNLYARGFNPQQTGNEKYAKAEASALPFATNVFDFAFSVHTAEYVPDKAEFLREVHRVLKPGAEAAIHCALMSGNFVVKRRKQQLIPKEFLQRNQQLRVSDERNDLIHIYKKRPELHLPLKLSILESKALGWDEANSRQSKHNLQFVSVYRETKQRRTK